jgi:flagellar protein FliO/FliZ
MDLAIYGQFILALVIVLALIGLITLIARKAGFGPRMAPRSGRRRLALVEVMPLDPKRRLVLIRRDDTEHLLLLGASEDRVIETGIRAPEPPTFTLPSSTSGEPTP